MASKEPQGDDYFNSYSDLGVHELMLQDRPRTTFYRKFFECHRELVKGKVVMDVGAGTGILSLFAATAGAKKVYAVEASAVATICEEIIQDNRFQSVIQVIQGAVEDIELPDGVLVDIIVSEWMGFYLLHESMLDSVLVARDKFLAPGGVLVPSRACLYMAPVDMTEHFQERADYWSNIYGYDFSPIASTINIQEVSKPLVKTLHKSIIKSAAVKLLDLDLGAMSLDQVKSFSKSCKFLMSDDSRVHGFATWFDVSFEENPKYVNSGVVGSSRNIIDNKKQDRDEICSAADLKYVDCTGDAKLSENETKSAICCDSNSDLAKPCDDSEGDDPETKTYSKKLKTSSAHEAASDSSCVFLSTSPSSPPTHWKQTVIFLPHTIMVIKDVLLCCKVKMSQDSSNKRHYKISLELKDECDLDDDVEDAENSDDTDNDSVDSDDHPIPCSCGSNRCRLISALMEKYDTEHQELEDEAEMVEMEAEVEAAKELDTVVEREGWTLDTSGQERQEETSHQ